MTTTIKLTQPQWDQIHRQETLIKPMDQLGFTVRSQTEWDVIDNSYNAYPIQTFYLNFHDDHSKLVFLLKYNEVLTSPVDFEQY